MKSIFKAIIFAILTVALSIPMQKTVKASTYTDMGTKSNVAVSKAWTVDFNKDLNPASVNNANVVVIGNNNTYIDVSVILVNYNKSIVVKPLKNYESNTRYTLIVTQKVKSADGNPLPKEVRMNFTTVDTSTSYKIVLDAGHGGSEPGAIGPSGLQEKKVVLDITLKVGNILVKNGVETIYTRKTNTAVSLEERTVISNKEKPDYFVSIHANAFSNPEANGLETWYFAGNEEGQKLAKAIQTELVKETGKYDRGLKTSSGLYVLKYTDSTSVLVETSFLTNPTEEFLLNSDDYQNKVAKAISTGIFKCLGKTDIVY
ncbi:N-acetylmuramoyl-L-alanine amidase [Clostridium sp.]|jgi:N-acetylmuramoyl-L-alanine amidase|uniref:N-acetylmuramoyl-L-alanine amidase n=1 Tax=Clostridium sp. TaxID=1506 RepID=UPI003EE8AC4A